ncbi:hypothetical protein GCM10009841_14970 [Microlunatus panaciterrae]|uniref:Uncharacterized protein n=1 Tax=Microlunatus panaciterrae TaxID=400768 RepID=A0ABS2RM41_9ACTN|nr:hypothetical protein [Microlunatus panaciterrae]MBM7800057.1 hypothetical protein [Microlunatus panaciterrae]
MSEQVAPALAASATPVLADPQRTRAHGYYRSAAMMIMGIRGAEELEIGDGGFTDWTAQLLQDRKERCLISCLAPERLLALSSS